MTLVKRSDVEPDRLDRTMQVHVQMHLRVDVGGT
jgi:hypothetical protein